MENPLQRTVLIVDDSVMILRVVGQILKGLGYDILMAENGKQAYEMTRHEKPDLVLMDIDMPVMNGIEATSLIKSDPDTLDIPVVYITSLSREEDIRKAMAAGGQGFLNKPVCKSELQKTIANLLPN